jgi:hypothetical protein
MQIAPARQKGDCRGIIDLVAHKAVAGAPDEFIALAQRQPMLQVEIDSVQDFGNGVGNSAPGPVPIHLQGYVGVRGQRLRPSADQVLAVNGNVARPSLSDFTRHRNYLGRSPSCRKAGASRRENRLDP